MFGAMFGSHIRAALKLTVIATMTVLLLPVQLVALVFRSRLASRLPKAYFRWTCTILGITVKTDGLQTEERPMLFVCNHASYLDIVVLGSQIEGSFVSKADVRDWPVVGVLARLCRTVFIDRRRHKTHEHRDGILGRLESGDRLILFPEGTSNDGNRTLPFKSALFSVAEYRPSGKPLKVQPVSVAYTRLDGVPIGRGLRPLFAWYADMALAAHFWRVASFGAIEVRIAFHQPTTIDAFADRKALARHCHREVAVGLSRALAGRPPAMPAPA